MTAERQARLDDLVAAFRAPTVALGGTDGQIRSGGPHGVLHCDVRVLSQAVLRIGGEEPEALTGGPDGNAAARFVGVVRYLGTDGPDPVVQLERRRVVLPGQVEEEVTVRSYAAARISTELVVDVAADLARMDAIKNGQHGSPVALEPGAGDGTLRWGDSVAEVELAAAGAKVELADDRLTARLRWPVDLPPRGSIVVRWKVRARVPVAPVAAAPADERWAEFGVEAADPRLARLVRQALTDLTDLRMTLVDRPDDTFVAGGIPWFCTLFGRDSLWTARMLLPLGTELAAGTLRTLASVQGTWVDIAMAEQPGKIPHELRTFEAVRPGATGPAPIYYGSVDATMLWICLLHDAWRWGLAPDVVRSLLPNLRAALGWMADYGDLDGDGFIEYIDASGHGLANQGWKDSGDAIRFADGTMAKPPVALCEVQAYAYEAAVHGADLLDAFGLPGGAGWRQWAADLAQRFRERFWVTDSNGPYPALALDADKRPIDALASNLGYLLGTGMLDDAETALVVDRITGPDLDSGFGLRTMSARGGGYGPLTYHCGSVWPHDSVIVIRALAAGGHASRAVGLIEGLVAAGGHFGGRLPELYSGDARSTIPWPVPYPAACRPLAPTAAAAVGILQALLGIEADVPGGTLRLRPVAGNPFGDLRVDGLVVGGERFGLEVSADGTLVAAPEIGLKLDLS